MTDVDTGGPAAPQDRTEPVDIQVEMQRSYIDYAMSVIVGRALPDVRDGMKPVHTRILWAMYDGGYRPDRGYFKCARVIGEVMGQYHPHGDSAIYDSLVRLAQPPLYKIKWEGRGVEPEYAYSDRERDALIEAGIALGRKDPRPRDGVQRFKGLGEMNASELWETTMNPARRVLLQVTLDDAAQADELFSVLMGEDVEARRSFIQRNAKDVRFLDI